MQPDLTSTNPHAPFSKDDRPLVSRQNPKTKRWEAVRKDERYEEGGRIIARELASKDEADTYVERERHFVPRTDSTSVSRTRKTFTFDRVPDEIWERIRGS
jgi:hypothetical protein